MRFLLITTIMIFVASASTYGQDAFDSFPIGPTEAKGPANHISLEDLPTMMPGEPDPTYEGYVEAFKKAASSPEFSEKDANKFLAQFYKMVMPLRGITGRTKACNDGKITEYFPIQKLKEEAFYKKAIERLLRSENPNQRLIGYITVGSCGDDKFNNLLLKSANNEAADLSDKIWATIALIYLNDNHTKNLFDLVADQTDLDNHYLFDAYLQLDPRHLKRTALERSDSPNLNAKLWAIQSLIKTELDPETDQVLRNAIRTWDPAIKPYAITTAMMLHMGSLKDILPRFNQYGLIRSASLGALANSPSPEDQDFLASFIPTDSDVPSDLLYAYLTSTRVENVRKWLTLARNSTDGRHILVVDNQPLLRSDELLDDVKVAIRSTKNPTMLLAYIRLLDDRKDKESISILTSFLKNPNPDLRTDAAFYLRGKKSEELAKLLPELIQDSNTRTPKLIELAIENSVGGLHPTIEKFLETLGPNSRMSEENLISLEYLASFPRAADRQRFIQLLKGPLPTERTIGAKGLAELHDQAAVPLIADALNQLPNGYDNNLILDLLKALSKLKGEEAKRIIESYKDNLDSTVKETVAKLLAAW